MLCEGRLRLSLFPCSVSGPQRGGQHAPRHCPGPSVRRGGGQGGTRAVTNGSNSTKYPANCILAALAPGSQDSAGPAPARPPSPALSLAPRRPPPPGWMGMPDEYDVHLVTLCPRRGVRPTPRHSRWISIQSSGMTRHSGFWTPLCLLQLVSRCSCVQSDRHSGSHQSTPKSSDTAVAGSCFRPPSVVSDYFRQSNPHTPKGWRVSKQWSVLCIRARTGVPSGGMDRAIEGLPGCEQMHTAPIHKAAKWQRARGRVAWGP